MCTWNVHSLGWDFTELKQHSLDAQTPTCPGRHGATPHHTKPQPLSLQQTPEIMQTPGETAQQESSFPPPPAQIPLVVAQTVQNSPARQETWVQPLGQEDLPGERHGNPLQYSCLENPMDRGAWWATVHGVAKSQTPLSD